MRGSLIPAFLALVAATPGWAQPAGNAGVQQELQVRQVLEAVRRGPPIRPGWHGSVSAGAGYAFRSDLDDGGDAAVDRQSLAAGLEWIATNGNMAGFAFDREFARYLFSADAPALLRDSFDEVTVDRFGLNVRASFSDGWSAFAAGDVTFAVAGGAEWSDGMSAGGLVSLRRQITDTFGFSMGLLMRDRLEDDFLVIPIPGFDWSITPRLSLRTAQGVTLTWQIDDRRRWVGDFSAGYESRGFRLAEDSPLSDAVVEDRRIPVIAGLTYRPLPFVRLRGFVGAVAWQEYEIRNAGADDRRYRSEATITAGAQATVRF